MAADVVEGQRGGAWLWVTDFAVGDEAGFNECLESVADTEHESIAVMNEIMDGIADAWATEDGGDEFTGAIRLIASGESTWQHEDLGSLDLSREGGEGFLDSIGGEIPEDEHFGIATSFDEGFCGIVFAIGAGEGGHDHAWTW